METKLFWETIKKEEMISSLGIWNLNLKLISKDIEFFDEDQDCELTVLRKESRFYVESTNEEDNDYFYNIEEAESYLQELVDNHYQQYEEV